MYPFSPYDQHHPDGRFVSPGPAVDPRMVRTVGGPLTITFTHEGTQEAADISAKTAGGCGQNWASYKYAAGPGTISATPLVTSVAPPSTSWQLGQRAGHTDCQALKSKGISASPASLKPGTTQIIIGGVTYPPIQPSRLPAGTDVMQYAYGWVAGWNACASQSSLTAHVAPNPLKTSGGIGTVIAVSVVGSFAALLVGLGVVVAYGAYLADKFVRSLPMGCDLLEPGAAPRAGWTAADVGVAQNAAAAVFGADQAPDIIQAMRSSGWQVQCAPGVSPATAGIAPVQSSPTTSMALPTGVVPPPAPAPVAPQPLQTAGGYGRYPHGWFRG